MPRWFGITALAFFVVCGSSAGGSSSPAIAATGAHTCRLAGGSLTCWGLNDAGQLGDGTTTNRLTPVQVSGLGTSVQAVSAGASFTCALLTGGGVDCWGENSVGQLGDGTRTNHSTPAPVSGLSGARQIAAGGSHACALTAGGGVECWGLNSSGQLGDGTGTERLTPVAVSGLSSGVTAIAAGALHTCAVLAGGGVKCWGFNLFGQIGDGTEFNTRLTPVSVSGLAGARAVGAGDLHTCALLSGGGMKCWGANGFGELGDGTTTNRKTPVPVSGLGSGVTGLAVGTSDTCAILSGGAKCWGDNSSGELGDGTTASLRRTPVTVTAVSGPVEAIATGSSHTCAVLGGDAYKCWGSNHYGQLGNGKKTNVLDVQVRGHGTVSAPGLKCFSDTCSLERDPGTKIVVTERPAKGWVFKGWSGACKGRVRRCTIVLATDKRATARFAKRR